MTVLIAQESRQPKATVQYPSTIVYPESDGKPVGETDWHISVILYLRAALRFFFRQVDDLYVAANMLVYYEEGDPHLVKVPDVFVVKGVNKADRATYKLWEENAVPCVIFEITSRGTRWQDIGEKKGIYEYWGVKEYFLFDPLNEYLKPRLQGFRLVDGAYQPIERQPDGRFYSEELALVLAANGRSLRLIDPLTGEGIPSIEEAAERAQQEAERAKLEAARAEAEMALRQAAEAREKALERELAELRRRLDEKLAK